MIYHMYKVVIQREMEIVKPRMFVFDWAWEIILKERGWNCVVTELFWNNAVSSRCQCYSHDWGLRGSLQRGQIAKEAQAAQAPCVRRATPEMAFYPRCEDTLMPPLLASLDLPRITPLPEISPMLSRISFIATFSGHWLLQWILRQDSQQEFASVLKSVNKSFT